MASDLYSAAWDFARLNLGTVGAGNAAVFASATGGPAGNLGFTSGMYMHGSTAMAGAATIDGVALGTWPTACDAIVGGGALAITFDRATLRYTLSSANAFSITWNGAQGAELAAIFGFSATSASATSHVSTQRPKYLIRSRVAGQSQVHETYEPSGRIAYAESDGGHAYSTCPDTIPTYRDWVQPFETTTGPTDAEYGASSAATGAPMRITDVGAATKVTWSWQAFGRHVRASLPFALIEATAAMTGPVYKFVGDAAHFDPTRVTADFDGHWSVPFRCRYLGELDEV